ncbi:hypothetical protein MKX01_039129 [Papaver californicum]|nr:hypothetical protein MKX01_039129 [Papaver californicum]
MSAIVGYFNRHAQKLLQVHLSSGFKNYFTWIKRNFLKGNHVAMVEEGKELVTYCWFCNNKILKTNDIHYSKQGQAFKSQAQGMHTEILQSPWLCELIAFHINLKETKKEMRNLSGFFEECLITFGGGKPSLSFSLFDSVKLDIDLTCSICLLNYACIRTLYSMWFLLRAIIYSATCACSASSVTIVDGLKAADPKAKCPLCREVNYVLSIRRFCAVHLEELNILLSRRERVRQAKEHWESHCRALMGV